MIRESTSLESQIQKLKGPITVFGAGGFIGIHLLQTLRKYRDDVYGISHNFQKNWRFAFTKTPRKIVYECDISRSASLKNLLQSMRPQSVFNLAAYGAYPFQKNIKKIYRTNFEAVVDLIEQLKINGFHSFVNAGSQSEYGENSEGPSETGRLFPNSHYAVSKAGAGHAVQYYGTVEKLPVVHLRLYSVYGPLEEPSRLIPRMLHFGLKGGFPPLVNPEMSRDFLYVSDAVRAFIAAASVENKSLYGSVFNVGTGKKTTIRQLAYLIKDIYSIKTNPRFGEYEKRDWDHSHGWYADISAISRELSWSPHVSLRDGLISTNQWQKDANYNLYIESLKK